MQEIIFDYKSQKEFHKFVASTFSDLKDYQDECNKTAFNRLLLKILSEVKRYIIDRLSTDFIKGKLTERKYCVDDFIDQLCIEAYYHFEEVEAKDDLYPWLFKKADDVLKDTIKEEEFEKYFFENIDNFTKPEWDEMEERFSINGEGELIMIDDLDDILYRKNDSVLNHVFVEDYKKEIIEQLDRDLGKENIRKHTALVLHHLPMPMRTVFELATKYEFTLEEIAMIRNLSFEQVRQLLENARKSLEVSLFNRYAL